MHWNNRCKSVSDITFGLRVAIAFRIVMCAWKLWLLRERKDLKQQKSLTLFQARDLMQR